MLTGGELLRCALPQDAALVIELNDARGYGAVDLQEQFPALLPERIVARSRARADGNALVRRTGGTGKTGRTRFYVFLAAG